MTAKILFLFFPRKIFAFVFPMLFAAFAPAAHFASAQESAGEYLRLADRLDRPQDGYCLDIPGAGDWVQLHRPLVAHNCKIPGRHPDELVRWTSQNQIRFPAYDLCATAQGVFRRTLPGAPVVLNQCGAQPDQELQIFIHRSDGKITLQNSGLCLQVGNHSDRTWEESHRWRTLSLQPCENAPPELSVWEKLPQ